MYFSGFCLSNEDELFSSMYEHGEYTVAGFSCGAQHALEYAISSDDRIDRLILISPAFFHASRPSFLKAQERYFKTNMESYVEQFYANVAYPLSIDDIRGYGVDGSIEQLHDLLHYEWDISKLQTLKDRGVVIEVFIGAMDKIIDTQECIEFFKPIADSLFVIKNMGHLICVE